jgi:hypothetical protein
MIEKDEIAYLLLRLTLGANIFLHGFSRLIGDHAAFAAYIDKQMHNAPLPGFLVHFVGIVLPWCEGAVGLLMITGPVDISRPDRRQPLDAHATDRDVFGSKLGCRRSATHLRVAVLYLADVLRKESLVG